MEVTSESGSGEELLRAVAARRPNAVVVDMRMPPTFTDEGLQTARQLRAQYPHLGILVLSTYSDVPSATKLLAGELGGVGYLLKDRVDDEAALQDALGRLCRGERVVDPGIASLLVQRRRSVGRLDLLSQRERGILRLMAEGRSNLGISQAFFLSQKTVEGHVASIFRKLGSVAAPDDNRRVLAVIEWLVSRSEPTPS